MSCPQGVVHPDAPPPSGCVRMDDFYSMWRSHNIPCPKGSGRPACEMTLLHCEDFKIPENLARFAVRHGMAGQQPGWIAHFLLQLLNWVCWNQW